MTFDANSLYPDPTYAENFLYPKIQIRYLYIWMMNRLIDFGAAGIGQIVLTHDCTFTRFCSSPCSKWTQILIAKTPQNKNRSVSYALYAFKKRRKLIFMKISICFFGGVSVDLHKLWESKSEERSRVSAGKAVGFTTEIKRKNRKLKFPTELIFGPEQLEVINNRSKVRIFLITGEAGCGKTTTLLAILFKYTGKHVAETRRRKVEFFIPQEKVYLRRDIRSFVERNCVSEWVKISPLNCLNTTLINTENVYLIDEFYGPEPELTKRLIFSKGTFYIATISVESKHGMLQSGFSKDIRIIYFRRLYRSTSGLSKICAKVRRLMDRKLDTDSHMNIPWAMSFYNGAPMKERTSIEVWSNQSDQSISDSLKVLPKTERTLLVLWKTGEEEAKNIYKQFPQYTIFYLTMDEFSVNNLTFTGSEFRNVILAFGGKVDCESEYTTLLLYNSMTRATERAFVLCSATNLQQMKSILSLSTAGDIIFEKLRSAHNLGSELFLETTDPADRLEIMKRIVATKNEAQVRSLKENGLFDSHYFSEEENQLVQCMRIMIGSPTDYQPLVDLLLLEKKMPRIDSPTLGDIRPVISLFEPLRFNLPWERTQKMKSWLTNQIEQREIFSYFMERFHPTDRRHFFADWIRGLTNGNANQVAEIVSLYDTKKVENILTSFFRIISGAGKAEILRNSVLTMSAKAFRKDVNKYGINVTKTFTEKFEDDGSTLIHKYAYGSNQDSFKVLLDFLPEDLVWFSEDRLLDRCLQNPLMTAIGNTTAFVMITQRAKRQGELVTLLARRDVFEWSCLRWACRVDNLTVVKALIENKDKSLDWTVDLDPDGRTLIHLVCAVGHTHILRYLLTLDEKQPEPFKVTKSTANSPLDMTCLHLACLFGRAEIVKMLIEAVPDLVFMDFQGINCFTLASHSIFKDKNCIVNLLEDKLPVQQLNDTQEVLIHFMVSKIRSLNHNNFVDETEVGKIHPNSFKSFYFIFLFLFSMRIENQENAAITGSTFTVNCYICWLLG